MRKLVIAALVLIAVLVVFRSPSPQPEVFTSLDELIEHLEASNKLGAVVDGGI